MWPDRIRSTGCRTNPRGIRKTSPATVGTVHQQKECTKQNGGKIFAFLLCLTPKRPFWHGWCLRHANLPLGKDKQTLLDRNFAFGVLPAPPLGKVVFKILKGEIRGEQPISALCTSTGFLWKMSVFLSSLLQSVVCWRACPNIKLVCVLTASLCSFSPLEQLFPLGCGSRGQSPSLSHPAFTEQPDQALPEIGLQRIPCPDVKTCTTPIISWDTTNPLVFCTQGALNSPSPACWSRSLNYEGRAQLCQKDTSKKRT